MSTDVPRRLGTGLLLALAIGLVAIGEGAAAADRPARVRVGADTEIRSIRFVGADSLPEKRLRSVLRTRDRGSAYGLRVLLGKLPLVPSPERHPFRPRVLQEDVVRLREEYADAGFSGTEVTYRAVPVEGERDLLDLTIEIREGTPRRVTDVAIVPADGGGELPVPPEERGSWRSQGRDARELAGRRLDLRDVRDRQDRIERWWRNRGFPDARVRGVVEQDSLELRGHLRFLVDAGHPARFGAITVEGNPSIDDGIVLRELSFRPGDPYSAEALRQGPRDLQDLQIVRGARFELLPSAPDPQAPADSVLPVRVTVSEAKPHLISGQIGYVTDAGFSGETQWSHRNFTGGARVLSVSGLAQTGVLSNTENPDIRYRGALSLLQPYVLRRRLSAAVSPFVEYRNDVRERSLEVGGNVTLLYRHSPLLSGALDYHIATRDIREYRLGELAAGDLDLTTLLGGALPADVTGVGGTARSSLVTLSATAGNLDDFANPRRGVLVRPALHVTAPSAWSSAAYWKADGSLYSFLPLTARSVLAARVTAGRLFPFGKSVPDSGEVSGDQFLRLREDAFTAGGAADVRGWAYGMLGPKVPDLRFVQQGDSLVAVPAGGYVPLTGLSRFSFTLELRLPFRGLGPRFGSHLFLDGGKVWTGDSRFRLDGDPLDQERLFYAAGAGLDFATPAGSIRFSAGYKLNPSLLDLVDAADYARAVSDGTPLDELRKHEWRRLELHLSFGTSY